MYSVLAEIFSLLADVHSPRVGGRAHKIFRTGVSPGLFWDWKNLQKFWNGYDAHSKTTCPWGFQKGGNPPLSGIRKILCTLPRTGNSKGENGH